MCLPEKSTDGIYREKKGHNIRKMDQKLQLPQFPVNMNQIPIMDTIISTSRSISTRSSYFNETPSSIAYWCNRGVGILLYNASIACFCPPQYYGDKCQFHSDRLTVLFHLNLTQSIYAKSNNYATELKILIIFLYGDQPLMTDYFHARPADEITVYKKTMRHLLYSRSDQLLQHKRVRHFNRTNIISEHPYSVRIEAYELNMHKKARLEAVWLYPIYFDFLPSFRLGKVLLLMKPDVKEDPCQSNPCGVQQECHPLLNQKSNYVCLCPTNFKGNNCSIKDEMCKDNFCSTDALCKPNYRGLLNGNERPFCICPLNAIGPRCDLKNDQCDSNPCQNGGTCFATSELNNVFCLCDNAHYGKTCQSLKRAVRLYINESVEHRAALVQYFEINFRSLDLILVEKRLYAKLPHKLDYLHKRKKAPEIIVVNLYSDAQVETYLISLQINVESINGTTEVSEKNRCAPVHTLFAPKEGT
jgi:hypothetical protein